MLTIAASIVMILLGLQMLRLFPALTRLIPTMPKAISHRIHDLAERRTKAGAFVLGAVTFFLPCGLTQALELYVLAKGRFHDRRADDAGLLVGYASCAGFAFSVIQLCSLAKAHSEILEAAP